jgi:pentatricopeptide repeat protein
MLAAVLTKAKSCNACSASGAIRLIPVLSISRQEPLHASQGLPLARAPQRVKQEAAEADSSLLQCFAVVLAMPMLILFVTPYVVISQAQCTKASQLPTALGLVADMRRRGIAINNHTYCALLSVCLKANELDLALNIFQQLQLEGVTPSIVTYNIILEVYAKQGMWQQALQTVNALNSQVRAMS